MRGFWRIWSRDLRVVGSLVQACVIGPRAEEMGQVFSICDQADSSRW